MANIKGTNIGAPIVPFTDQDIYATHEARYGKGGYRTCESIDEMNRIPAARLEEGMMVYVINDPSGLHTYQYIGGKWVRNRVGLGIPIYNQQYIEDVGIDPKEDTYISIPDISDLHGDITGKTYTTTGNGNYVDILFSAIRSLQAEVARLRNSFMYGIESYTGTTTAMSVVEEDLADAVENEPLWAIEEDGLSLLQDFIVGDGHTLVPADNVTIIQDAETYNSYLKITGEAKWLPNSELRDCTDSKLFVYATVNRPDIKVNLSGWETEYSAIGANEHPVCVDFNKIRLIKEPESGLYNILLVISRKVKADNGEYYGKNFIWASIGDPASDTILNEGYWKEDGLYEEFQEQPWRYDFKDVTFNDLILSKLNFYSKWQDFTNQVIPSKPSDETYKFKAAHITIRAVENQSILTSIKDQILDNELIFVEETKRLWIKTNNQLAMIAGGSGSGESGGGESGDTGMTTEEMIAKLKDMGIVQLQDGGLELATPNVADIIFIHEASGKKFRFYINESGEICNQEIPDASLNFKKRVEDNSRVVLQRDIRGFIGQLRTAEKSIPRTNDAALCSDRLKIGAFYAPFSSDLAHGCSHSFIELENTADVPYSLENVYLHFTRPDDSGLQVTYHLPLTGTIPAGGTYLIRGAQHAPTTDPNVFIKVNTCDQEWYIEKSRGVNELISFEINEGLDYSNTNRNRGYGFCLTYGMSMEDGEDAPEITYTTKMYQYTATLPADQRIIGSGSSTLDIGDNTSTYPYILYGHFIDGLYYKKMITNDSGEGYWAYTAINMTSNSMYKNMFELDPAKQAFQAFTTKDSSRCRWASTNDIFVVDLSKEYVEFPHTEDKFAISKFTPKASWEHKNVCTDKTKLDPSKPNMVTCSFGINMYKTRCFNWISLGYFDEYVWIKKADVQGWNGSSRFQSYIPMHQIKVTRKETVTTSESTTTTLTFNVTTEGFTGGDLSKYTCLTNTSHANIYTGLGSFTFISGTSYQVKVSGDGANIAEGGDYYLKQASDDTIGSTYPKKKGFNADITNNIYARISGRFPGDNSFYTSHKVIVDIVSATVSSPTKYTYVVGRAGKDGLPDLEHCSEEMSFTLYPTSAKTRIYQTSDQQGFHWIEYQVWAAAAKALNDRIVSDTADGSIIPVLINTGDMTQNGTRINEWFDYYQAGRELFSHLEQMNVVGNNDLCGTDPSILGTGDDTGKSNSFYFHLFYCYEVDPNVFVPLISNQRESNVAPKYVPSLYYFDSQKDRFLMVNSEITEINCRDWYGLQTVTGGYAINAYTGYDINGVSTSYHNNFTTIYTMIFRALQDARNKGLATIAACHEMPFTVITNDSLLKTYANYSRSISNAGALVGSHLNQISKKEISSGTVTPKGIYWFSRLLEFFGVKLCIGGHKHTYSCTYPVRENYKYTESGTTKYSSAGIMTMTETLENDTAQFIDNSQDTSKFPLVKRADVGNRTDDGFYPCVCMPNLTGGVVYFMCQATGYKLTSNKELPSSYQKFSMLLPETKTSYNAEKKTYKDTASAEQKYPMFSMINVDGGRYDIKLARVQHIMIKGAFNQKTYDTASMAFQYLKPNNVDNYGTWSSEEKPLIEIN